ncbi:MAG: DUF86 domain-containing protein [Chloroflexi bacterium]|nr:DUF86 domain-containing protein [Chloroflexota bacterium]
MSSDQSDEWVFRIGHIFEAVERIQDYIRGMTFQQFCDDPRTVQAVLHNFLIIGEATRHIPATVQTRHPTVPWKEMRDMRNILAHEYDRIDLQIIWDTAQRDIPKLPSLLQEVLAQASE